MPARACRRRCVQVLLQTQDGSGSVRSHCIVELKAAPANLSLSLKWRAVAHRLCCLLGLSASVACRLARQTVANFYLAFEQGLALLPVLNKIDLPSADPGTVISQMGVSFDLAPDEVLAVSAKTGQGVAELLAAIVE